MDLCILNCLMFMGFYHLGLYFTRRNDKSPLYFALFSFIVAIRTLSIDDRLLLDFAPLLNFSVINKIDYFTFFISGTFFLKFVESLFPDESNPKLSRWLHFFYLPPSLLVLFTSMYTYGRAVTYVEIGIFLSIIYIAHIIVKALKNHKVGAKLFLSGFIILTITAINDILKGKAVVYTPYTLGYGFTIFIIFQASILIRKYSFAFIKSEELARDLEDKVIKRTAELQTTLEQVKELKFQQDGDYFLTSQLLKPLSKNKADSTSISITFLTRQKKRFQFREWHEEIGGDLCMSNQIILGEKKYTVLVNADAMGKSLLGASGALVFGSVFESIINRNQNTKETQYETPDQWIKQTFLELHRVFETFDGSMLVSLVLVLIEEKSRSLFMINADHPPAVLYRDVKAVFLSPEQFLRKLGTIGANENISVLQYQLFPNDILILGSDGRDDLLIKSNDGTFLFNENDSLFLSQVEKCRGDLESIYNEMMKIGVLYDDLTLIKISVHS
nr:7TM diverse intracellular signaling domain-containing protein [Leptospira ryugenii]